MVVATINTGTKYLPVVKEERVVCVKDKIFGHVERDDHRGQDGGVEAQEVKQLFLLYEANCFGALK